MLIFHFSFFWVTFGLWRENGRGRQKNFFQITFSKFSWVLINLLPIGLVSHFISWYVKPPFFYSSRSLGPVFHFIHITCHLINIFTWFSLALGYIFKGKTNACYFARENLADSGSVIIPYNMVTNRRFITLYGIITGSLSAKFS